jgi:hypothetical protein
MKRLKMTDTMLWIGGFLSTLSMPFLFFRFSGEELDVLFFTLLLIASSSFITALILTLIRPVKEWRWVIASSLGSPLWILLVGLHSLLHTHVEPDEVFGLSIPPTLVYVPLSSVGDLGLCFILSILGADLGFWIRKRFRFN